MLGLYVEALSVVMYLDEVFKSPNFPDGSTLSTVLAILLAVLATYGTIFRPIETQSKNSSSFIAVSSYVGGAVFNAIEACGTAVSAFRGQSPTEGRVVIPDMKDVYCFILGLVFQRVGTFVLSAYQ